MYGQKMSEKAYRAHEGISRSSLWKISESPEKFKYALEHPEPPTSALLLGQLFHKLVLLPDEVEQDFTCAPNVDRRTKEGKTQYQAFLDSVGDKTIVDVDTIQQASEMSCALYNAKFVKKLLAGERETAFFWVDELTGEPCKARVDCLTEVNDKLVIVDLKTAVDASTDGFMKAAVDHGYDFQAAMYSEAVKKATGRDPIFVFIAIEKKPPYAVNVMQADDIFIKRGYDVFRELIGTYHECKQSGEWYGYMGKYSMINNLALPAWLAKEVE